MLSILRPDGYKTSVPISLHGETFEYADGQIWYYSTQDTDIKFVTFSNCLYSAALKCLKSKKAPILTRNVVHVRALIDNYTRHKQQAQ
jgi:hypothetical protein